MTLNFQIFQKKNKNGLREYIYSSLLFTRNAPVCDLHEQQMLPCATYINVISKRLNEP